MKVLRFVLVLGVLLTTGTVSADKIWRFGGGVILDGMVTGVGIAVDMPTRGRMFGFSIAADYYTKSGATTAPIRGFVTYRTPVRSWADFYVGAGSGIVYSKISVLDISLPSTKVLASAVGGLNFKLSESFGIYSELSMDRPFTSGAKNNTAFRVGLSFSASK